MKYAINHENLSVDSSYTEAGILRRGNPFEQVQSLVLTSISGLTNTVYRALNIPRKIISRIVPVNIYSTKYEYYKFNEEAKAWDLPDRILCRHSAFLYEAKKIQTGKVKTDESAPATGTACLESCEESNISKYAYINVKKVVPIPVWSTNIDDIGIIRG